MNLCCLHCFLLLFLMFAGCDSKYAFIMWKDGKAQIAVTDYYADIPDDHIARATYNNEINETGYCYQNAAVCGTIEEYVNKNEEYISSMINMYPRDPYWHQMKLFFIQLEGLAVGYNEATKEDYQWLTVRDIIWLNMLGDLDELAFSLSMPDTSSGELFPDHCSGLVKLLPDHTNLYVAHSTWNSYQSMLRIQKMYVLNFRLTPESDDYIPGRKMAMSSYPGLVQSTDDFYIISSGLVCAETTTGNSNRTLFEHVKPRGQILEYARAMIANRLARDGREWVDIFRRHNSGTYNNQWYIVDYNKFKRATGCRKAVIKPGLLWLLEQLPSYIEAADLTEQLKQTTYFPSYNIPYFPRVFNLSGGNVRVETFGDWFGYRTNPRALIMKKKQAEINDLRSMYYTMRYNDFKHDPYARCEQCRPPYSSCNAIAARNDLNPANGSYPFRALGHRSHGATDAKITSALLQPAYQFVAVSSPTHNITRGIPPFSWSEFDLGPTLSHVGHPDVWLFTPLLHQWEWG